MDLHAIKSSGYELLDSGDGGKLERFGEIILDRPCSVALWNKERPEKWASANAVFERSSTGSGNWKHNRKIPANWQIPVDDLTFMIKPTSFGHVGLFPEHSCHWHWIRERISKRQGSCNILHLFAYTGSMSIMVAKAGAAVCHVDAVQDINDWARKNAEASGLASAPIRWITDDVTKFVTREVKRGRKYDGIIFDPPSYGKGAGGEKWVLEEHLQPLIENLLRVMSDRPEFVLFTCHTTGFSPPVMKNMLLPWKTNYAGNIDYGTMLIPSTGGERDLPCGFYARWHS